MQFHFKFAGTNLFPLQNLDMLFQFTNGHFFGAFLIPRYFRRRFFHRHGLLLKTQRPLDPAVSRHVENDAILHDPDAIFPDRSFRVFNPHQHIFAVLLDGHALHQAQIFVKTAGIRQSLQVAAADVLDDNMLLRLWSGVFHDFIVDNMRVCLVGPRYNQLVESHGKNADKKRREKNRRRQPVKAQPAAFHRHDLAGAGKTTERHQGGEQHRHRKRQGNDRGQTERQ